jgi:SAM-dependent methyltransferase
MKEYARQKILRYYSNLLKEYGYDPRSIGWGYKKGKQSTRFEILCQIGNLSHSSMLDVGCGFGDLYGYLKYKKIQLNYLGVDINEKLLDIAKQIYPQIKVEVKDIEQKKFTRKFDWILASGITSHSASYPYLRDVISKMFMICKKGMAMNFVSDKVDFRTKGLFYSSPEKIMSIAFTLSNRVVLRHDYMPYEFTVYIYKNNKKTENNIFDAFLQNSRSIVGDTVWHPAYGKIKTK